jgi:hypothetical protein
MLIELIKERKINGDIFYYVNKDGNYVNDTVTYDEKKALEYFEKIQQEQLPKKEVIKSIEIIP